MITVYELQGTGTLFDVGGTAMLAFGAATTFFQANLDPAKFTYVNVSYPASAFPMNQSIDAGVTNLTNAINGTAGQFILIGWSQGAIVISNVYDQIRSGSLTGRNADFLGAVTFGNPRRENGHTFPGCPNPGGNGIAYTNTLTGTETRWHDFANPGDTATCNDNNTTDGQLATSLFSLVNEGWDGTQSVLTDLLTSPVWTVIDTFNTVKNIFWDVTSGPHTQYGTTTPLSPGDTRTCVQIALDYINLLTTPIAAFGVTVSISAGGAVTP